MALKYAVRCGGGTNHRMGLYDGVLIKENHIAAAGGHCPGHRARQRRSRQAARCRSKWKRLAQLQEALRGGARMILLDNVDRRAGAKRCGSTGGRAELEASGGVDLDSVRAIAETGVDRISIGPLTKDIKAVDLSMRFLRKASKVTWVGWRISPAR